MSKFFAFLTVAIIVLVFVLVCCFISYALLVALIAALQWTLNLAFSLDAHYNVWAVGLVVWLIAAIISFVRN